MKNKITKPAASTGWSRWLFPLGLLAAAITAGVVLGGLASESAEPAPKPVVAAAVARPQAPAQPAAAKPETISRVKLDLDGAPSYGPAGAPVTIVEYMDYECPFCRRAHATVNQVKAKYGDKVRLVYLQNPLSFHKNAPLAAKAALAAGEQGRYREMHDMLLAGKNLERAQLLSYAQSLGLDVARFTADLDSGRFDDRIQKDQAQAARIGATATPFFFINGRTVRGAQPMPVFEKIIDEELAGDLAPTTWVARAESPRSRRPQEDPNKIYKVDMANSISRGPADAPITLVEFTAFQCGFCRRSQATITQIMSEYPGQVRHVVMYKPLRAPTGAIASLAADRQGKYWEYRDLLFANSGSLTEQNLFLWAQQVGMDVGQFEKDLRDPALAQFVQNNSRQASGLGVSGTPTFFINGKKLVGAQPFAAFKQVIDQQLAAPVAAAPAT